MSPWLGLPLALLALFGGGWLMGWQGVVLAMTLIVFWLLLQFRQLMKVMSAAKDTPLGHVESALVFNTRLHEGMKLLQVLSLTKSLGEKCGPEVYLWSDTGGDSVEVTLHKGKVASWTLKRAS